MYIVNILIAYFTELLAFTVQWLVSDAQEDYTLKSILTYHVFTQYNIIIIDRISENSG